MAKLGERTINDAADDAPCQVEQSPSVEKRFSVNNAIEGFEFAATLVAYAVATFSAGRASQ